MVKYIYQTFVSRNYADEYRVPHTATAKVTDVLDKFNSYYESYVQNGIFPKLENYFERYGFEESYFIRGCNIRELGDVESRDDLMVLAQNIAEKIIG